MSLSTSVSCWTGRPCVLLLLMSFLIACNAGGRVYEIPGKLFQVPTAYVWIFTARLVTGQGLPYMAKEWAMGAGALFAVTTLARTLSVGRPWRSLIPGGIAVAVGKQIIQARLVSRNSADSEEPRHVQCAVVYARSSHWRHHQLVLAKYTKTVHHASHHCCIGKIFFFRIGIALADIVLCRALSWEKDSLAL